MKAEDRFDVGRLTCYGCAHSAARVPYPSHPSGEFACGQCIRAHHHAKLDESFLSPDPTDKDMYIPLDRLNGICDLCSHEGARLVGNICIECWPVVHEARDEPV